MATVCERNEDSRLGRKWQEEKRQDSFFCFYGCFETFLRALFLPDSRFKRTRKTFKTHTNTLAQRYSVIYELVPESNFCESDYCSE